MADRNGTLQANTLAKVNVESDDVEILNRDGAAEIWVTVDGGTDEIEPGDEAPGVRCIPAVAGAARVFHGTADRIRVVRLISDGTPTYSVTPL